METNDYTNVSTLDSSEFCPKCHKPYFYVGDIPEGGFPKGLEPYCICGQKEEEEIFNRVDYKPPFPNYGWICPVCGAGLAPHVTMCHCKAPKWEITCTITK